MYKRVLLKLSGEALSNENEHSIFNVDKVKELVEVIKKIHAQGVELGIVIGGGNIWRGKLADQLGIERVPADFMGMMGTVINCLSIASSLNKQGCPAVVYSAVHEIEGVVKFYDAEDAKKSLSEGKVVFFAGGIGKPYFSTDTAASTRALETNCEAIFMAKHGVDGIYDKDPNKCKDAKFFKEVSYQEVIDLNLGVMDISAAELVKNTDLIIRVFSMQNTDNILSVINGSDIGSTVRR